MARLQGKVAIITGAASGQGAAEARLFAAEGAQVIVADINDHDARAVAEAIGSKAVALRHDVSDEGTWDEAVALALDRFGTIDILVNNAAVFRPKSFQETDLALLDLHYRVNVAGMFLGMKAVYPAMLAAGRGAIVNISSAGGLGGNPGLFAYGASKWMVRGMSRCAAKDLSASGIRVNTIIPGVIDTPMLAENDAEQRATFDLLSPAGRMGTPEEVAEAALFLASDAASYVMGAEISVCGGLTA